MFTYDCILAAALLTAPVESAELAPHLAQVQPMVLQLAIDIEILDPREDQYLEGLSKDPVGDLTVLRNRYAALVHAPHAAESDRFPPRKLVEDFLDYNRKYRKELVARLQVDPIHAEQLQTAVSEVDQLHHVWTVVRDFRCNFYYVTVRRQSLQNLRELVGDEAFYRGDLPPSVPYWHFPRLK